MLPMFGKVGAINDQHPILFTQCFVHQTLVFGQQGVIIPPAFPNELLEGAYLPLRMWSHPQQAQGHRFHILTGNISREQSAQIDLCPLALLTSIEQWSKVLVVDNQFFGQGSHLFRGQFLYSQRAHWRRLVGGDIIHKRHQISPPGIDFLPVYPTKSRCNTRRSPQSTHTYCYNAHPGDTRSGCNGDRSDTAVFNSSQSRDWLYNSYPSIDHSFCCQPGPREKAWSCSGIGDEWSLARHYAVSYR